MTSEKPSEAVIYPGAIEDHDQRLSAHARELEDLRRSNEQLWELVQTMADRMTEMAARVRRNSGGHPVQS